MNNSWFWGSGGSFFDPWWGHMAPNRHPESIKNATQKQPRKKDPQGRPRGSIFVDFSEIVLEPMSIWDKETRCFRDGPFFASFLLIVFRENFSRVGVGRHVQFEWDSLSEDQSCHFWLSLFLYFSRKCCFSLCGFWMRFIDRGSKFHFFSGSSFFS